MARNIIGKLENGNPRPNLPYFNKCSAMIRDYPVEKSIRARRNARR
jgi:hypothetical protein